MSTKPNKPRSGRGRAAAARRAAAETTRAAEARGTPGQAEQPFAPAGRPSDVFGGELRRRDVFCLLVLHLISGSETETSYGNQLIEQIEKLTGGVLSLNPNTMYPLLRDLENRGLIRGQWEHPKKRSRRFYSVTPEGKGEYERLVATLEPFLDSIVQSITLIKREIYGPRPRAAERATAAPAARPSRTV